MFLRYVPRFPDERNLGYVPRFPMNIRAYVPRCHMADERKPMFIGPNGPVGIFVRLSFSVMVLSSLMNKSYIPRP
jgi:hypothetical protein